jgi:DNA-binding response OmpR family regulator
MCVLDMHTCSPTSQSELCQSPFRPDDVFIVEDEPVARRALLYLMLSRGYSVSAFGSAEEAIKSAKRSGIPRVLLVDLHLPGMNGIEFIRHLENASAAVFPVLITAAGTEELDRIRGRHPVICLPKPLDFGRLVGLLEERHRSN